MEMLLTQDLKRTNPIKFQSPFERLKLFQSSCDVALRKAIITQAIIDASNISDNRYAVKLEKEAKKLENERLKLENEEKRALVEGLRKKHDIGGSKNMYDRVKPEPEPQKENWFVKLWKS